MKFLFLSPLLILASCGTKSVDMKPQTRDVASEEVSSITSRWLPLYVWTDHKEASEKPKSFILQEFKTAQTCLSKMQNTPKSVAGCEGPALPAGPGIIFSDNPFVGHDKGRTLIMIPTHTSDNHVRSANTVSYKGQFVDRTEYKKQDVRAIRFPFRPSDEHSSALIVRNADILQMDRLESLTVASGKKWNQHASPVCDASATGLDIVRHYGDHMDFLSLIYRSQNDPTKQGFRDGDRLNDTALIAATASDAVAVPMYILKDKVKSIQALSPEAKYSLDMKVTCPETGTTTLRSCVARRVYDSIMGDVGTDLRSTYAWDLQTALKALQILEVLSRDEARSIQYSTDLQRVVVAKMRNDAPAMKSIHEAFTCVQHFKDALKYNHLGMW